MAQDHPHPLPIPETAFVSEMRLSARHWLWVGLIVALVAALTPAVWKRLERFDTGPDYRIPYSLSKDYWLYQRRIEQITDPQSIVVLGDSVVWGEYVAPDGSWSHFLNQRAGQSDRFVNAGVNGLFPLALEGLVDHYGGALRGRKILLHCNLLWLSSPKADLRTDKEEKFNHVQLVPQFSPRIPCYKAGANERLGISIERSVNFLAWVNHLQNAYFDQKSILNWTLSSEGDDPPRYPNSYKNPLAQIGLSVPVAPADDPLRGPRSPRHKPWTDAGGGKSQFEWVELSTSLQWGAFQRLVETLRRRGNDVFVVIGPFNEHFIAAESLPAFRRLRDGAAAWFADQHVPHLAPEVLPSPLYADASHPLTAGYELLAQKVYDNPDFQSWLRSHAPAK